MDGILIGFTEAQILEIRESARASLAAGGRVVTEIRAGTASGTGINRSKSWEAVEGLDAKYLLKECRYALHKLDPVTYPRAGGNSVKRIYSRFRGGY